MPRRDPTPPITGGVVLRGFGLVLAIALSGAAAWLIVTSTTQRHLQLGVLAGLWAALLGAFAMFGARRRSMHGEPLEYAAGAALELRAAQTQVERAEDAAARRAHELRLEQLLRHEIHGAVAREISALRQEIAFLRSELLEKVDGRLRLERIETTRVIGSDLEALQHELRELKAAATHEEYLATRRPRTGDTAPLRQVVEAARVRPVTRQTAAVEADVQPARIAEPPPAGHGQPGHVPPGHVPPGHVPPGHVPPGHTQPGGTPPPSASGSAALPHRPPPMTSAPPPPPAQPAAPPAAAPPPTPPAAPPTPPPTPPSGQAADAEPSGEEPSGEDFAKLPRIPPFTDFELEPVEQQFDEPRQYTGRRRRPDDTDPNLGRHAQPGAPQQRYRQDPSDVDEILARLLPPRNTNGRS